MAKQATKRGSTLALWDLTIPIHNMDETDRKELDEVIKFFNEHCGRWVFQWEIGESGYHHFQCRVSLNIKRRVETMARWLPTVRPGWHFSPTSNPTFFKGNMFYVMKEETRHLGPWSDVEEARLAEIPKKYRDPNPVWRPFQQKIVDAMKEEPDDRIINYVYQEKGKVGKSHLVGWHCCRGLAHLVPELDTSKDIARMVMCMPISTCYFFDLPKSCTKKHFGAMFAAIERIKDGFCYDERNKFKSRWFNSPHVWVFSNTKPDIDAVSPDRWQFWTINQDKELIPLNPETLNIGNISEATFINKVTKRYKNQQ